MTVLKYKDITLSHHWEEEDDNVKIWHEWHVGFDNTTTFLNHTPYETVSAKAFEGYVTFYAMHGRVPEYGEFGPGNARNEDLEAYDPSEDSYGSR